MPTIADLNVAINANTTSYIQGLQKAETRTKGFTDRGGKLLKGFGKIAAGGAIVAAGAAAGAVAGIARTVDALTDVEQELRPAIERSRIAAESLQILAEAAKRAGSEDGLEAIVDSAQELQLQLGEIALLGKGRATDALNSLGLVAADLQKMEPEAAFRAVLDELQKIPNAADRAFQAEEIFGGASEKLSGIINLTAGEFAALQTEVEATSDIWSGDALASAKVFDQEIQNIKTDLGRGTNALVVGMLPALTRVAQFLRTDALPAWQEFKDNALGPIVAKIKDDVLPILGNLWDYFQSNILPIIRDDLIPLIKDQFVKAWNTVSGIVTDVVLPALMSFASLVTDTLWPALRDNLIPALQKLTDQILPTIKTVWETVVKPALSGLIEIFEVLLPAAIGLFSGAIDGVVAVLKNFNTTVGEKTPDVAGGITAAFSGTAKFLEDELIPVFKEISDFVWPLIVETWEEHLKPTFEDLMDVIKEVSKWVKENEEIFIKSWGVIKATLTAITKGMIILLEGFIGIFTAVLRVFLELITGDWKGAWEAIKDIGEEIWELISGLFLVWVDLFKAILDVFGIDLGAAWSTLWQGVQEVFETITGAISTAWETWTGAIRTVYDNTLGKLFGSEGVVATALGKVRDAWKIIQGTIKAAWMTFTGAIQKLWDDTLGKLFGEEGGIATALEGMKKIWNKIWTGIKDTVNKLLAPIQKPIDAIRRAIDAVKSGVESLSNISVPDIPGLSTVTGAVSKVTGLIPGLASGGTVTRGGVVDVHARERVFLPQGAQVQRAGAGGGGNTYVFNFPNYVGDQNDLRRMINEARLEFERRGN